MAQRDQSDANLSSELSPTQPAGEAQGLGRSPSYFSSLGKENRAGSWSNVPAIVKLSTVRESFYFFVTCKNEIHRVMIDRRTGKIILLDHMHELDENGYVAKALAALPESEQVACLRYTDMLNPKIDPMVGLSGIVMIQAGYEDEFIASASRNPIESEDQ